MEQEQEKNPLTYAWKQDEIIQLTLTGTELQDIITLRNILSSVIDREMKQNVITGKIKPVYEEDLVEKDGKKVIREDIFN